MKPRAVVFDAYGTLFDVHTVVTHGTDIDGDLRALSVLWRQRQLEYTWLRSRMERYEDFWSVTKAALRSATRQLRIAMDDAGLDRLMKAGVKHGVSPQTAAVVRKFHSLDASAVVHR